MYYTELFAMDEGEQKDVEEQKDLKEQKNVDGKKVLSKLRAKKKLGILVTREFSNGATTS